MTYKNIVTSEYDGIAILKFNRPEVRNALNEETVNELEDYLEVVKSKDEIGVLVFTGAGDKAFAAGADISQLREKESLDALKPGMQAVYDKVAKYEKPTIAMINGVAAGGGCELSLACDIRVASENAKIGLPELNLGIIPSAGGTQRLTRLIGKGKASELILRGKLLRAEEAEKIGMINHCVTSEELLETVEKIASDINKKGPLAVRLAKYAINRGLDTNLENGLLLEKFAQALAYQSEDKYEGTSAFLEKRTPDFKGK